MTFAWYYHLKQQGWSLLKAITVSWLIALIEYAIMVPANRIGYQSGLSGFQLKMIQEVITLFVFGVFAVYILKEPFQSKHLLSFSLLIAAAWVMFR